MDKLVLSDFDLECNPLPFVEDTKAASLNMPEKSKEQYLKQYDSKTTSLITCQTNNQRRSVCVFFNFSEKSLSFLGNK